MFLSVMTANLLVIVEFACHGDLLGYLLKSRGLPDTYYQTTGKLTRVTAKKMMVFAWQIADGMNFLAENKVKRVKENYIGQNEGKSYLNVIARERISSTRSCLYICFHINYAYIVRAREFVIRMFRVQILLPATR